MRLIILSILISGLSPLKAQNIKMAFYNVENLFHPSVDSLNPDLEFTPNGRKSWDTAKYYTKLNRISKVILSLSDSALQPPALVGFSEVESAMVLNDLINRPALQKVDYQWVHYDSPDRRGIDVGLIYRKSQLKLIKSKVLPYFNEKEPNYQSRDILYAQFTNHSYDTLNVFVCHWPSRYGGKEKSAPRRLAAARVLCQNLKELGARSSFVAMGDFNDEPQDSSITYLENNTQAYSLMQDLDSQWGSHRHKGNWAYLDQFIISHKLRSRVKEYGIHKPDFLLIDDSRYPGKKVYRSFQGDFFSGGFSDHLPIFLAIN